MKKIQSALISVFYKDGLEPIVSKLSELGITIYSTGGTQQFIEQLGIEVVGVEKLTGFPPILGGRVKTLHPGVFGGILARRDNQTDIAEIREHQLPPIDLVIVDLYPFEETLATTNEEKLIIEKIDIGGPSMIRAAAKNFRDVLVIAAKKDYSALLDVLNEQNGSTTLDQRKLFAARAFETVAHYDVVIAKYFTQEEPQYFLESIAGPKVMRYGENPHQDALYFGKLDEYFTQLNGKELSYNNLVDIESALQLVSEFRENCFAIIKHTNVCGIALRKTTKESWDAALAGDPESAFGGVLVTNGRIDMDTAKSMKELFFEVLIADSYDEKAFEILKSKKNRILLQQKKPFKQDNQFKSLLNGVLMQASDQGNVLEWKEVGGRESSDAEKEDLEFANLVCKHLKSNAITLVKNKQLIGKGCGQTSRIDSLRQAIEKAKQFKFDLNGAIMASDAFFPFDDCVKMGDEVGITAFIQPGGSIRDKDSIDYCVQKNLVMVLTGMRHFKH